jgi:hypothetical protein
MLQGLVYDNNILRSLYNGSLMKSIYKQPYIKYISTDKINVRLAKYNKISDMKGELLVILTSNEINIYDIDLIIKIPSKYKYIKCNNKNNCITKSNSTLNCKINLHKKDIKLRICFNSY